MKNIIPILKYIKQTIKHKYYVFYYGLKNKVPIWQLIIHDLSKFGPHELPHYGRHFFGDKTQPVKFSQAWLHHQNVNRHHWEYWIPRTGHIKGDGQMKDFVPMKMPEKYVREMLADWLAASRVYTGLDIRKKENWPWYNKNKDNIKLHPESRRYLEYVMDAYFNKLRYEDYNK